MDRSSRKWPFINWPPATPTHQDGSHLFESRICCSLLPPYAALFCGLDTHPSNGSPAKLVVLQIIIINHTCRAVDAFVCCGLREPLPVHRRRRRSPEHLYIPLPDSLLGTCHDFEHFFTRSFPKLLSVLSCCLAAVDICFSVSTLFTFLPLPAAIGTVVGLSILCCYPIRNSFPSQGPTFSALLHKTSN